MRRRYSVSYAALPLLLCLRSRVVLTWTASKKAVGTSERSVSIPFAGGLSAAAPSGTGATTRRTASVRSTAPLTEGLRIERRRTRSTAAAYFAAEPLRAPAARARWAARCFLMAIARGARGGGRASIGWRAP